MSSQASQLEAQIPTLRRYARSLVGDRWAADDLVQDTLERACERWHLWRNGTDLRAWLFTLMHNLFIDGMRRQKRQAGQPVGLDDVALELGAAADGAHQIIDLQRCLLRLPLEQREVLLLVALQDLTYQEVAHIIGAPIGTVMSRLFRARAKLRSLMDRADEPPPTVIPIRRI